MFKHSFNYYILEEYVEVTNKILKEIKKEPLKKDKLIPEMNLTSYHIKNKSFDQFIENELNNIFKKHNLKLKNCWVQKYCEHSYHCLHTHNVYEKSFLWFIEGDKKSSPTTFYDVGYPLIDTNQIITFNFTPGTLLIFPGFLPHEVKPNKNNNRLIVSGNVF